MTVWSSGDVRGRGQGRSMVASTVVLATPDTFVTGGFQDYLRALYTHGLLYMVVVDGARVYCGRVLPEGRHRPLPQAGPFRERGEPHLAGPGQGRAQGAPAAAVQHAA